MKTLSKSINEQDSMEKGTTKDSLKYNFSISSKKKLTNKSYKDSPSFEKSINIINKNNDSPTIFYLSNISISNEEFINSSNYQNINKIINQIAYHIQPKNKSKYFPLSEKILLDLFINISEFNESNYDFYISYFNLCKLLREINLINTPLINDVAITQNDDLDIILKEILSNNNSKKLNFKDFLRFLAYLTNKIDPLHFIDKPRNALNFIISKYFYSYYENNKNNLISLIFSYIFTIKLEKDINKILEEIINFLNDLYISFFKDEIDNSQSTDYCVDEKRNPLKYIINSMKYLGIFPVLINIKELAIMYFIFLDDNNNNNNLNFQNSNIKEMNKNFTFGKFCQFFLTLSLYIKEKNFIALKQYTHLLIKKENNNDFDNILKNGIKEGIIKFIMNLKIKNLYKQIDSDNSNLDFSFKIKIKEKNKVNSDIIKLDSKELNFIRGIFESYSSDFDQYFNYQISFSEIITFLKHYNLLAKNNNKKHSQNFLKEELSKAQNNSRNNIIKLKRSLHSLDFLFDNKINKNNKVKNNNLKSKQVNLVDVEIIFSKVIYLGKMNMNINKSMDNIFSNTNTFNNKELKLKHNLNFKCFVYFLFLISTKLTFNSFYEFIAYLSDERDKIKIFKLRSREINLKDIYQKYNELNASELIDIIQEFSPLINIYYLLYTKELNKNDITFNLYKRIFAQFEIFPKIVNNEILKNIFYVLYHIKASSTENIINNIEETKEENFIEKNREIGFKELMNSFGIIALYLSQISELNIIQSLLSLFYIIIKSEKIKPSLKKINTINFNFVEVLKNKVIEISKKYKNFMKEEEPEFIKFLKNPYL